MASISTEQHLFCKQFTVATDDTEPIEENFTMATGLRTFPIRVAQSVLPLTPVPEPSEKEYRLVSMFSGCGGMDVGFLGGFKVLGRAYRRLPFRIVWANELNPAACRTYRRNLGTEIHCGDVWDKIDTMPAEADVLIGGFPCQDVSVNGKRVGVNGKRRF